MHFKKKKKTNDILVTTIPCVYKVITFSVISAHGPAPHHWGGPKHDSALGRQDALAPAGLWRIPAFFRPLPTAWGPPEGRAARPSLQAGNKEAKIKGQRQAEETSTRLCSGGDESRSVDKNVVTTDRRKIIPRGGSGHLGVWGGL